MGSTPATSSGDKKSLQEDKKNLSKARRRYLVKSMFQQAKVLERHGQWRQASDKFHQILDIEPLDAHSYLGLARLQARREQTHKLQQPLKDQDRHQDRAQAAGIRANDATMSTAREAFQRGTSFCPNSIHLWQAWAVYEEARGNLEESRRLFEKALEIDSFNPYVCHAYGLMEKNKWQNPDHAQNLWERALTQTSTAALVCSLGELFTEQRAYGRARDLYQKHLPQLTSDKDKTEVYLAMAWLEERYYGNFNKAQDLLECALELFPTASIVHVALARLEGRRQSQLQSSGFDNKENKRAVVRTLVNACMQMEQQQQQQQQQRQGGEDSPKGKKAKKDASENGKSAYNDGGRVYNALAHLEVKDRKFDKARRILAKGMQLYPKDPMVSVLDPLPYSSSTYFPGISSHLVFHLPVNSSCKQPVK
jgi:tetratricopeptide (TPR) repeat protein